MAIDLYLGNCMEDVHGNKDHMVYPPEVHEYMWYLARSDMSVKNVELLSELNPYGDKIFTQEEINNLIPLCHNLKRIFDEEEVLVFLNELIDFCLKANERGKLIISYGD